MKSKTTVAAGCPAQAAGRMIALAFVLGVLAALVLVAGCSQDGTSVDGLTGPDAGQAESANMQAGETDGQGPAAPTDSDTGSQTSEMAPAPKADAASGAKVPEASGSDPSSDPDDPETYLQVRFLDVGQGDCALVSCEGHHLLIDGGPPDASQRVYAALKNEGVEHLDAIIATHPDADHIGGIAAALNAVTCGTCYCSVDVSDTATFASMKKYLDAQGVDIVVPSIPTTFNLGAAQVNIIGPVRDFGDDNENSLVCRIAYGQHAFLFMGDAETQAEQALVASGADLQADLVKIGHHGSSYSTTPELLAAVQPAYAIISVGANNDYGHPTQEVLDRLSDAGVDWWRTDWSGDIIATCDGEFTYVSATRERVDVLAPTSGAAVQTGDEVKGASDAASAADEATAEGGGAPDSAPSSAGGAAPNDTTDAAGGAAAAGAVAGSTPDSELAAAAGDPAFWHEERPYVLNENSKKIHKPDCASVDTITTKNRRDVVDTYANLKKEYTACGNCKPDKNP